MKRAELALLDGILAEDAEAVLEACVLNPMIRSADHTRRYFRAIARQDLDFAAFGMGRRRREWS